MNIEKIVSKRDYHSARQEYDNHMFINTLNKHFGERIMPICCALYQESRCGEKALQEKIGSQIKELTKDIALFLQEELQRLPFFVPRDKVSGEDLLPIADDIAGAIEFWCKSVLRDERWRVQDKTIWDNYFEVWLNYNYANVVAEKLPHEDDIADLLELTEKGDYYFYHRFCEVVNTEWFNSNRAALITPNRSEAQMIDTARIMSHQDLSRYIEELSAAQGQGLSLWQYTKKYVSGAEYVMLDEELELKSHILLNKPLEYWCEFWLNLKLPIVQTSIFNWGNNPDLYIRIADHISKRKEIASDHSYLYMILLERWFNSCCNVGLNLSYYDDEETLKFLTPESRSEGLLQLGKEQYRQWKESLDTRITSGLEIFCNVLPNTDVEEWLFENPIHDGRKNRYNAIHNEVLSKLTSGYLRLRVNAETLFDNNIEVRNLQQFIFLCDAISGLKSRKEEVAKKIIYAFVRYIKSANYFWNQNFEDRYMDAMRKIAMLLSLMADPVTEAMQLLNRVKLFYSGWNVEPEYNYKHITAEIFTFCGVGLLLEVDKVWGTADKPSFFSVITERLLLQAYNAPSMVETYYQRPMFLYYIIATQILSTEDKEKFEKRVISEVDDLMAVFSVLGSDKIGLEDSNRNLLKERIETQLPLLQQRLEDKPHNNKLLEQLNSYRVNLGIF